jgi:hypothetical protein
LQTGNYGARRRLRTPLVDKEQLASMSFSDLSSTTNGDGEIYYQAIQSDEVPQGQRDDIVVIRQTAELKLTSQFPPGFTLVPAADLGTFKAGVYWQRIQCPERKVTSLKMEIYDASNNLKYLAVADLSKELQWSQFEENSPFALLQRIRCGPHEVQK